MVESKTLAYLKDLFMDYAAKEKILFLPNHGFANYQIETKFGYTIAFHYEYVDNLYNIKIIYHDNVLVLTSYKIYKHFVNQKLKQGLLVKHSIIEHFDILFEFIDRYHDEIARKNDFFDQAASTANGYDNIFL